MTWWIFYCNVKRAARTWMNLSQTQPSQAQPRLAQLSHRQLGLEEIFILCLHLLSLSPLFLIRSLARLLACKYTTTIACKICITMTLRRSGDNKTEPSRVELKERIDWVWWFGDDGGNNYPLCLLKPWDHIVTHRQLNWWCTPSRRLEVCCWLAPYLPKVTTSDQNLLTDSIGLLIRRNEW